MSAEPEVFALGGGVHVLRGAVNVGLVEAEGGIVVIDTGLDKGAGNRIARAAEALGKPIAAIVNTHAHADHHGGNAQLVRRFGVPVHAPAVEAEIIREPRYEPVYLFGGAAPPTGLVTRFLQAEPSPVDHVFRPGDRLEIAGRAFEAVDLAGHSLAQVGIRAGGVLFAADGYFGREALEKHGVPFLVDAGRWMETLREMRGMAADWMVPGHGEPLEDARDAIDLNLSILERATEWVAAEVARRSTSTEDLLPPFAAAMGMRIADPPSFALNRVTLLGILSTLERAGRIRVEIADGRWIWAPA